MKTFRDAQGREWSLTINVASLKRVNDALGLDLTQIVDPDSDVVAKLTGDMFLLFECLCTLLQPQLDQHDVSPEAFGESLDEESTEKAATALFEAIIDFFREDRRMLLKRAFSKVQTAVSRRETQALERAMKGVESPEFDRVIGDALDDNIPASTSGSSSTASPASSASIPANSR